jgi:hypothetical protein
MILQNRPNCIHVLEDACMRVPDEVRQCVAYLGLPGTKRDGRDTMLPKGTAFFVSIASETVQEGKYIYLVTAKHVATALEGKEFFLRLNTKDGGSILVHSGPSPRWWLHPTDESVDVAALTWVPPDIVQYKNVPTTMFLTDEIIRSQAIGTGDEVFITGLFVHLAGSQRNLPIVRMGNIAMMPDELVPTKMMGLIEAYLIEARSIGGLSGSPAFVRETVPMGMGGFYLLGLMHGHWDIPPQARDDRMTADDEEAFGKVNMGIAVVVPAKKISEVLNQATLVEARKRKDEEFRKERMPTLDEAMDRQAGQSEAT